MQTTQSTPKDDQLYDQLLNNVEREPGRTLPSREVSRSEQLRPQGHPDGCSELATASCRRAATSLLLLVTLLGVTPGAYANDWIYTVRPGDQLWNLAQNYCGTHTRWRDLAAHNQLSNPNALRPGSRLRFPLAWLTSGPASVELIYTKGEVQLIRAAAASTDAGASGNASLPVAAQTGATLTTGDRLLTGDESFATVRFADESRMRVGPASEVVFDTLTSFGDTGMVDTRVRIVRGGAESSVAPQVGPGAVYRIGTPLGVAAVRGTSFRTRAGSDSSFVEMTEGKIQFDAASGDKVAVEEGNGLVASAQGVVVETLLEAPRFVAPGSELTSQSPLEWQPIAGAVGYVVTVANAANPNRTLIEQRLTAASYAPAALAPGNYQVKVRGVAASGLEGIEAEHRARVSLALGVPSNVRMIRTSTGRNLRVSWDPVAQATAYEVRMHAIASGKVRTHTVSEESAILALGAAGDYEVQVLALAANIRGDASPPQTYRLNRRLWWPWVGRP